MYSGAFFGAFFYQDSVALNKLNSRENAIPKYIDSENQRTNFDNETFQLKQC